jgi:hypothetical protein
MFEKDEKFILAKDAAEGVVKGLLDYLEIDIEEIEDKDAKKVIKQNYGRLVKSVRMGRLEIKIAGKVVLHLRTGGETLEFVPPNAQAKKAMADKSTTDFYGRIYALMGSCCGLGEAAIDKISDPVDLSIIEVLGSIFLSV